jgi:hypothetical protein
MTDANLSEPPVTPLPVTPPPSEPPLRGLRKWALAAELVSAAAVVVSLIFVGLQLADSNELAREAAEQKQIESIGALSRIVAENPYIAEVMAKSQAGEKLTPAEQVSATSLMTYGQRTWEALYYQYRDGRVSPELWEAHRHQARAMQGTPLSQAVWKQRKSWFSKSYQEFRDSDGAGETPAPAPYDLAPLDRPPEPVAPAATPKH